MRSIFKITPTKYCFTLDYKSITPKQIYKHIKSLIEELNVNNDCLIMNIQTDSKINDIFDSKALNIANSNFYKIDNIVLLNYILDSEFIKNVKELSLYIVCDNLLSRPNLSLEKIETENLVELKFSNYFTKSCLLLRRNKYSCDELKTIVTPHL